MYSAHGYNFSSYGRTGKEPNATIGKQHVGNLSLKYLYNDENNDNDKDEEEFEDIEEDEETFKSVNNKIVNSLAMTVSDPYSARNADHAAGQTKNTGGLGLFEFAGNHKNVARKGMAPYKQPKHSGPPLGSGGSGQAFRTTGNKIDLGTRKGHSRPHDLLVDEDDGERYFSLTSLIANTSIDHQQFKRQKNRMKKVINDI